MAMTMTMEKINKKRNRTLKVITKVITFVL